MSQNSRGKLQDGVNGFAVCLALIASFLATPYLDQWTTDFAMGVVASNYGAGYVQIAKFIWLLLLAGMVFFISKIIIWIAFAIIGSWGLMRFGAFI